MVLPAAHNRFKQFGNHEDGGMIPFTLFLFLLMVMMGGMAVDLMRYEDSRVTLQQTLDRSTLAAAAMTQDLDPEIVVADYMAKAGLSSQLDNVIIAESATMRSVTARGKVDVKPFFLQMMGIDTLPARAVSTAEQSVDSIEISLVLDVSGSMGGQKIADLRDAASNFVTEMLENDPFGRISIAIVPYNAQVNLGAPLRSKFREANAHGVENVDCLELPDSAFATPGVPLNVDLPMMAYADIFGGTNYVDAHVSPTSADFALPVYDWSFCRPNQENIVRLPSQDLDTLVAQINALTAGGNTSITLGMKWGMTLLDPNMRSAFEDLADEGEMDAGLTDRPFDFNEDNVQKVVVLMTDGEHVPHYSISDDYKTGPSPIYLDNNGNYSVFKPTVAGPLKYYVPHLNHWQAVPFGGGTADQQNWEDIWASLKVSYVAWQFNARPMGAGDWNAQVTAFYDWYDAMVTPWKSGGEMDVQLQATCAQARSEGVMVFGIAFQAPTNGETQIRSCSTNNSYYFDAANGDALNSAFDQIATNLSQLRLTQ